MLYVQPLRAQERVFVLANIKEWELAWKTLKCSSEFPQQRLFLRLFFREFPASWGQTQVGSASWDLRVFISVMRGLD